MPSNDIKGSMKNRLINIFLLLFFSLQFSSCQAVGYGGYVQMESSSQLPVIDNLDNEWLNLRDFQKDDRWPDDPLLCNRYSTFSTKSKVPIKILSCSKHDEKGYNYQISPIVRWDYGNVKKNQRPEVQAEIDKLMEEIRATLQSKYKNMEIKKYAHDIILA